MAENAFYCLLDLEDIIYDLQSNKLLLNAFFDRFEAEKREGHNQLTSDLHFFVQLFQERHEKTLESLNKTIKRLEITVKK